MSLKLAALIGAAAMLTSACSADRPASSEYFKQLEGAVADYDQATDQMLDLYSGESVSAADVWAAYERVGTALEALVRSVEDLRASSEAKEAHVAFVAELRAALEAIPALVDALTNADSAQAIGETIAGSAYGASAARLRSACVELETVAADQGLNADLHCRLGRGEYFASAAGAAEIYESVTDASFLRYRTVVDDALEEFQMKTNDANTATIIEETEILREITIREITTAFDEVGAALGVFVAALDALEPPAEAQNAHSEALASLTLARDAVPDLVEALGNAGALGEISVIISESDFGEAQPRTAAACADLERVAANLGIATDLHCADPATGDDSA